MSGRWTLREVPADLVQRYLEEGLWSDRTLGQVLAEAVDAAAAQPFRIWSDVRPFHGTVGEVATIARRLAGAFGAAGVAPGDVVTIQVPNWMEAVAGVWAAAHAGAVVVPLIDAYSPGDVEAILRQTGARLHLAPEEHRGRRYVDEVLDAQAGLPDLQHVWSVDSLADRLGDELREPVVVSPDDVAVVCFTSGSSAAPKGVIHTHRTFLAEIEQQVRRSWPGSVERDLVVSPIGHMAGMVRMVVLPVVRGNAVYGVDRWQPAQILDIVRENRLTTGSGVPYFLASLLEEETFRPEDVVHVSHVGTGGAPIPEAVVQQADDLGISLVRGYGATEHPTVATSSHKAPREERLFTEGRPLAGVELRILDAEGAPCPAGVEGDLWTRGPELFMGYVDPRHNAVLSEDGWFDTGDRAVIHASGSLAIKGRSKDIVIRGGENISAALVERALMALPDVVAAAVVAAPDERFGERVCAFVTCVDGARPELEDVRRALSANGVNRLALPEELHVVAELPHSAAGKVDKAMLRKHLATEVGSSD